MNHTTTTIADEAGDHLRWAGADHASWATFLRTKTATRDVRRTRAGTSSSVSSQRR